MEGWEKAGKERTGKGKEGMGKRTIIGIYCRPFGPIDHRKPRYLPNIQGLDSGPHFRNQGQIRYEGFERWYILYCVEFYSNRYISLPIPAEKLPKMQYLRNFEVFGLLYLPLPRSRPNLAWGSVPIPKVYYIIVNFTVIGKHHGLYGAKKRQIWRIFTRAALAMRRY